MGSISLGDAMALGCAFAWAIAVLSFRKLAPYPAQAVNLFKTSVAAALLLVTMAALGVGFDTERSAYDWVALVVSGVLGLAVADTIFLAGLARIDASVAAVADCAYSPTVVLLAAVFLHEPMGLSLALGAPLVVLGLVLVAYQRRTSEKAIDRRGVLLVLGGVFTTAVGIVIAKRALERSELVEATTIRLASGAIALFLFEALRGRARRALSLFRPQPAWRPLWIGTIVGTYVVMLLWLGGMKYGAASRVALLNQMGAIFVLLLSRVLLGEDVPPRRWAGALVAVTGVVVVLVG